MSYEVQARPVAVPRHRPLLFALIVMMASVGCGSRPVPDHEPARRATRKAIRLVRPTAPLKAKYVERLVADAEVAAAAELHAPWWAPQTGRGAAAWLRAVRAASEVARAHRSKLEAAQRLYEQRLTRVREAMNAAEAQIREAGMGRREAAAIERSRVLVATAKKLAAAGDFERGAERLQSAQELAAVVSGAWKAVHARFVDPRLLRDWQGWARVTIERSRSNGGSAIIIDKLKRRLDLYLNGSLAASFPAELGANGLNQKLHAGDQATPEGMYWVVEIKQGRATTYYKALLINYPNDADRARFSLGKLRGTIPQRAGIGSLIEIHGEGGQGRDWTQGCIALTNDHMDRLVPRVSVGTPVTIVGTYER